LYDNTDDVKLSRERAATIGDAGRRRPRRGHLMFCLCCSPAPSGFQAEGLAAPVIDIANAMRRRAAYDRRNAYSRAPASHPEPTELVIRNVRAVTGDPGLGDIDRTDIQIRDGEIFAVGRGLAAADIEIDGEGLTALPGRVAAHQHLWREMVGSASAAKAEPRDLYCVLRLALLDRLSAGVTSLHLCGIDIGSRHAETAVLAQIDSGLRGRFSYPLGTPDARPRALRELQATWFSAPTDHLIELGIAGAAEEAWPEHPEFKLLSATGDHGVDDASAPAPDGTERLRIGALSPGQPADLVLVAGDRPWSARDAAELSADRVDLVCIDGRVRKRNGVLLEPNEGLIRREGAEAIARIMANAPPPTHGTQD
jgi:hypothetical protein